MTARVTQIKWIRRDLQAVEAKAGTATENHEDIVPALSALERERLVETTRPGPQMWPRTTSSLVLRGRGYFFCCEAWLAGLDVS